MFHFSLRDKGYLFLGNCETVSRESGLFRLLSKKSRLYQKIGPSRMIVPAPAPFLDADSAKTETARKLPARLPILQHSYQPKSMAHLAQQALLETFAPASVLIDRHYRIHYYHGSTEKYLLQAAGEPTQDLRLLVREGLRSRLRAGIARCFASGECARIKARVRREDQSYPVQVMLTNVKSPQEIDSFLLLTFEDINLPPRPVAELEFASEEFGISHLETELKQTRDELQISVEQSESANEELEASNEEVMSINEELQSANEELQTDARGVPRA